MARSKRNDLMAGIFILVAFAALIGVMVLVGKLNEIGAKTNIYQVRFEQIPGVKPGSAVLLAGSPIGQVTDVMPQWAEDEKTKTKRFSHYELTIEVPEYVQLYQDALISVETKLIGEGASINIQSVGEGKALTGPIDGRSGTALGSAVEAIGIGEEQKKQITEIIANVNQLSSDLKTKIPPLVASIQKSADRLDTITEKVDGILTENRDKLKDSMTSIKTVTGDLQAMIKENRVKIDESVSNIQALTGDMKTKLASVGDNLVATSGDVRALVAANRMNLSDTFSNMRQTSEQLRAASIEIRRAPWRLLHRPDEREADTLNIFDASRNYAVAAGDLRSTTANLESLTRLKDEGVPVDQKMILDMLDRVRASLDKYGQAEDALWQQWEKADK
ncbi:MAG: MCE family protein [Planctomycetes bacterium]|nr:MCE family protein [Planctomycetota bacterium]